MSRMGSAVAAIVFAATAFLAGCATDAHVAQPVEGTSTPGSTPRSSASSPPVTIMAKPAEVAIPRIEAVSSLVELGLNPDQTVQVPPVEQPMQAGWFTGGPMPGEPGPAVLLGHVNGGGQPGIFNRLHELAAGDEVLVKRADGTTVRFVVDHVDQVSKNNFPTEQVYGDTPGPELRLITCGGSFDKNAHSYRDNIIAYAKIAA